MKDSTLETLLSAARPSRHSHSAFTQAVMKQIKANHMVGKNLGKHSKHGLFKKLRTLHGPGLVIAIILAIALLGSVTYASIRFAPDLLKIIDKRLTGEGNIEYNVPSFKECYEDGPLKLDKFEFRSQDNLSDEEVTKTLQAKCELLGVNEFARTTWPTYGENKEWQDGDTIYYTRPDLIGTVKEISDRGLIIATNSLESGIQQYTTVDNDKLVAYTHGKKVDLGTIKPGDLVFTVVRASETYYKQAPSEPLNQPQPHGLVAVIKLALPEKYYFAMQDHVVEIAPCQGNPSERCAMGFGGEGVPVYPIPASEDLRAGVTDEQKLYEIEGTVTTMTLDTITIKASSGKQYIIRIGKEIYDDYNNRIAPTYDELLPGQPEKLRLRMGSRLRVIYWQTAKNDPTQIATTEYPRITLLVSLRKK